jgi:putative glycosyltransferase (TIGR04348 family)
MQSDTSTVPNSKPRLAIITPALLEANNGNWQTASRWASMLGDDYTVELAKSCKELNQPLPSYCAMIALHARRSATSIAAFAATCPHSPLWVVLTGTDLYRDIATDAQAQASLQHASFLVVLQEQGVFDLPQDVRHKAHVVFQSAARIPRQMPLLSEKHLKIAVVGHLRAEKSPETTLAVARLLAQKGFASRIQHVGSLLDHTYENDVLTLQNDVPQHYQWLGGLSHADSLAVIASSDVLLHPSAMEGGALAIIEAIQCGTPVIASRVAGHVGLLGADYAGLFDWGDAQGAATLLQRYAADADFQAQLLAQCAKRSALFDPATERQTLLKLLTI